MLSKIDDYVMTKLDTFMEYIWVNHGIKRWPFIVAYALLNLLSVIAYSVCIGKVDGHLVNLIWIGLLVWNESDVNKMSNERRNRYLLEMRTGFYKIWRTYLMIPFTVVTFIWGIVCVFIHPIGAVSALLDVIYMGMFFLICTFVSNKPRKQKEPKLVALPEFA